MKKLILIGIVIGIIIILTLPSVESAIPPTRAFDRFTTSNDTVRAINSSTPFHLSCSGLTCTGSNSSKTLYLTVTAGDHTLAGLDDVVIFNPQAGEFLQYNGTYWVNTAGGGEANTASNLGIGSGWFKQKVGVNLQFKSARAGSNIILTDIGNELLINSTATGGGSTLDTMENVGHGGKGFYAGNNTNTNFQFKNLTSLRTDLITVSHNGTDVNLDSPFKSNSKTCSAGQAYTTFSNSTGTYGCTAFGNATSINDLGDVVITSAAYKNILVYNSVQWVNRLFSINNQTAAKDFQIIGINNQTGTITTNQFSVNNSTCAASKFVTQINNVTGDVTCASVTGLGITSLNLDTSTAQTIVGTSNQITIGDVGATHTINVGTDIVQIDQSNSYSNGNTQDFRSNTVKFGSSTIVIRNPASTFGTTIENSAITENKTLTLPAITATLATKKDLMHESSVASWDNELTWANIGTAYVDIYTSANANGHAMRIDTNNMTKVTLQIIWTKIGVGTQTCQLVDAASVGKVLARINSLANGININATQTIPSAWTNTILNAKLQCKSTTSTDDPVFLTGQVLLRP